MVGFTFDGDNNDLAGCLLGGIFSRWRGEGEGDQILETHCSETYSSEPTKFTEWLTSDRRFHRKIV